MNGIDPVVVATGNDWRAIEAGAHVWASRSGRYTSLTNWEIDGKGNLVGTLEMPMALGLVGGATKTHPAARAALKILGVETAQELAEVTVAVGLAQNMAALRALATEGIQKGHMALHARNIAIVAGATNDEIEKVAVKSRGRSRCARRPGQGTAGSSFERKRVDIMALGNRFDQQCHPIHHASAGDRFSMATCSALWRESARQYC
jgi:hydroxymethylglutaryl-CoA reductase